MAWKEIKAMTAWEFEMIRAMEGYDWMLANDVVNREDQKETGYIGCMTMYYQKQDDEFSESWHSSFGLTQPPGFLAELRAVIHYLRESTRYRSLWEPGKPAWSQADYKCGFKGRCHPDFSARVDTGQYTYLFRCDEAFHDRDVRVFCYDKKTVKTFLKQWEKKYMMREKEVTMERQKAEDNDESQKVPAKIQSAALGRKREGNISWDEYFMGVASLSAMRSKDPNTQVGCCIVGAKNRIASVGYNGFPFGCDDDEYPWSRRMDGLEESETKYPYVVHSELNAILNYRGESLEGAKMYVTMVPCCECAKAIIQSGIREVIYQDEAYLNSQSGIAATRMFKSAGVTVRQFSCGEKIDIQI